MDGARRTLVVGGTGMLTGLCEAVPPRELVVAARFAGNRAARARLDPEVERVRLDWSDEASRAAFLDALDRFPGLTTGVLWIHSEAHDLSAAMLGRLSARARPPRVVHVFGTGSGRHREAAGALAERAAALGVPFEAVLLGRVDAPGGPRWMTDAEISAHVARAAFP